MSSLPRSSVRRPRPEHEQNLLEARVEVAEEDEARGVLAVAVDDDQSTSTAARRAAIRSSNSAAATAGSASGTSSGGIPTSASWIGRVTAAPSIAGGS